MAKGAKEGSANDPRVKVVDGAIATTLIDELRNDTVPPTDKHRLYSELIASEEPRAEYDKDLETLQDEIQEYTEYLVSLESFLDEYGSDEEIINQLRGEVESLSGDVEEALRELTDEKSRKVDRLRTDLDKLKDSIHNKKDRLDDLTDRANQINDSTGNLKEDIDGLEEQLSRRSDLKARTESLQDCVAELQATYDTIVKFREHLLLAMNGDDSVNQ